VLLCVQVENLHQYVESMKTDYLNEQCRMGNGNNPFLAANRREAAKLEAAARRVHPTLHLPASAQPTTQIAAPATAAGQPQQSSFPSGTTLSSAFSTFATPVSVTSSSSLFSTPVTPSPSGNLFGASGQTQLTTPFGTPSTPTLGSTPSPFASTSALSGTSLFSTPFGGTRTFS
jgi:nucleoporin p58/p45